MEALASSAGSIPTPMRTLEGCLPGPGLRGVPRAPRIAPGRACLVDAERAATDERSPECATVRARKLRARALPALRSTVGDEQRRVVLESSGSCTRIARVVSPIRQPRRPPATPGGEGSPIGRYAADPGRCRRGRGRGRGRRGGDAHREIWVSNPKGWFQREAASRRRAAVAPRHIVRQSCSRRRIRPTPAQLGAAARAAHAASHTREGPAPASPGAGPSRVPCRASAPRRIRSTPPWRQRVVAVAHRPGPAAGGQAAQPPPGQADAPQAFIPRVPARHTRPALPARGLPASNRSTHRDRGPPTSCWRAAGETIG
jgi:hypothetical protein